MDSYFDYTHSSTFEKISCDSGVTCSSCNNGICEYHQSYAEGSSIFGILVEDILTFDLGLESNFLTRNIFGCHLRETNLFKSQKVDGIMGLARKKNNVNSLVDTLFDTERIDSNSFSLCLGKENGLLAVGGFNSSNHLSQMNWTNMYDEVYYSVKVTRIFVDYHQIPVSPDDLPKIYTTGTVVDSGTTFTYLANGIYSSFLYFFNSFCDVPGNCQAEVVKVYGEPQKCFVYKTDTDLNEFFRTFPVVRIVFEGEATVYWRPENYLFAWPDTPNYYCVGVYSNFDGGNILGSTFMRGNDVFFDRSGLKIAFAAASCSDGIFTNRSLTELAVDYSKNRISDVGVFVVFAGSCLLMVFINFMVWRIWKWMNKDEVVE
jgi:hypothetical protein